MVRTTYDPQVIQRFADKLYSQANTIVFVWTLLGLAVGAGGGYALGDRSTNTTFAAGGAVVLGLLGFAVGSARAFLLKLQAQSALCQIKIEENTRKHSRPQNASSEPGTQRSARGASVEAER